MNDRASLEALAAQVLAWARAAGAAEAVVVASRSSETQLQRRDGRVEQASEAVSRGLGLSLLVDDRWTSNGTSDLRPEALAAFVRRSVEVARVLEPDPDRRLPDPSACGRGASEAALDLCDPVVATRTVDDRAAAAEALEAAIAARPAGEVVSASAWVAEGHSRHVRLTSTGFSDATAGGWFGWGGGTTLRDGERRPEAATGFSARYLVDLPSADAVADDLHRQAVERLGAGPMASGTYPLVVQNRVAGRILGLLAGPLSGAALHDGRSCLHDKLDAVIGSSLLTIEDDPLLPRGLSSHPWDGDGLRAAPRTVVEGGVLRSFYLSTYYSRKLGRPATTGGRSNWSVPPGPQPLAETLAALPGAVLVTGFLGGNANPATGDFSFGIRGVWLERGAVVRPLSEMNLSGNLLTLFPRLVALGDDPWRWSSVRAPSLVFDAAQFSGR